MFSTLNQYTNSVQIVKGISFPDVSRICLNTTCFHFSTLSWQCSFLWLGYLRFFIGCTFSACWSRLAGVSFLVLSMYRCTSHLHLAHLGWKGAASWQKWFSSMYIIPNRAMTNPALNSTIASNSITCLDSLFQCLNSHTFIKVFLNIFTATAYAYNFRVCLARLWSVIFHSIYVILSLQILLGYFIHRAVLTSAWI